MSTAVVQNDIGKVATVTTLATLAIKQKAVLDRILLTFVESDAIGTASADKIDTAGVAETVVSCFISY